MKCLSTAETIALVLTNQVLFTLIQVCQTSSSSSKGLLLINKEEGRTAAQTAVIFQLLQIFFKKANKASKFIMNLIFYAHGFVSTSEGW